MRRMRLIIIGLLALITLGGGGFAVYELIFASKQDKAVADPDDPPPPAPVKRPAFVPMDPFSVYIQPEGQKPREVLLIFNLEVPPDNVPQVNAKMHLLRDRYIRELLREDPYKVPARFTAKDLYFIRDKLKEPTDEVLGKGVVTQVLLLNIVGQLH